MDTVTGNVAMDMRSRLYARDPIFSFEFFPPKDDKGEATLRASLADLAPLNPAFISVTCGAAGSTRDRTRDLVSGLQGRHPFGVAAHITATGYSREQLAALVREYRAAGIGNFVALRGDPPQNDPRWRPPPGQPAHAIDVVRIIREHAPDASIGVAGYPEKHPEAPSLDADLEHLAEKVAAGADFVISQMFFDNEAFFNFARRARRHGVRVPILPGVMPITRPGQTRRFRELCGVSIPESLEKTVAARESDTVALREFGLAYCVAQCGDLLRFGAQGIHFYTLNQSRAAHTVYAALQAME